MRILVTGGAGFIGSHLCERLTSQGHEVLCLDNFFTGAKANVPEGVEIIRHDVCVPYSIECDAIYNLACPASPIHYQRDPVQTVRTCVLGAMHALELARRLKVPVLQASTSEIYGDPEVHPQPETYRGAVNPIGPRACYDEGKRCAETLFVDYARQYGVDIRIARIFNTYGPRMQAGDGRVVSNFIVQALNGDPITIYGDGQQTRSFCYVTDLVEGLISLMRIGPGMPVNLGNPSEITVEKLAREVIAAVGQGRIERRPLPQDDPRRRKPDISVAKAHLRWTPRVALRDGLAWTVEHFRGVLDKEKRAAALGRAG